MKEFKQLLSLITLFFFANLLHAMPVDVKKAQAAANSFFTTAFPETRSVSSIQTTLLWTPDANSTRSENFHSSLYVFGLDGLDAFVIISGSDNVYPVLAYSLENNFVTESIPGNILNWLEEYTTQIAYIDDKYPSSSLQKEAWENSIRINRTGTAKKIATAKWDQLQPYNNMAPKIGGKNPPAGCVATALAIVMKYHRWPDIGEGQHAYKTGDPHNLSVSAVFNTQYGWNNMPDTYSPGKYTQEQANNVAELMYHCGVISEMQYDEESSGAATINALQGMIRHMKYDKSAMLLSRDWYTAEEWDKFLKDEINANRPVLYSGSNKRQEGHQFILDGYDTDNYYHVNWGWSGHGNGYYRLSALDPDEQGTGGNSDGSFSIGQDAIIGLKKREAGSSYRDVLAYFTNEGYPYKGLVADRELIVENEPFNLSAGFWGNYGLREYNGYVSIVLVSETGKIKEHIIKGGVFFLKEISIYQGAAHPAIECVIKQTIEPGDRIWAVHQSVDSNSWEWIRGDADVVSEIILKESTTGISFVNNEINLLIACIDGELYIESPSPISEITIYNMQGQAVDVFTVEDGRENINISAKHYPSGAYIVNVHTEKGIANGKFLVK